MRRTDRGLLVPVPDQRPSQRFAPEVPDFRRTVTSQRPDEPAVGEEVVARLDDAELVAFGVGEHHMTLLRALADIDVPCAEGQRPGHRLLLVLHGVTGQIEVHPVLHELALLGRQKTDPEPGVVTG